MNNIVKITFAILVFFTTSCGKFLEEKPQSLLSPETLPQNEKDADMILLGSLRYFADIYDRPLFFLSELSSDQDSIHNESMDWLSIVSYTYTNESGVIRDGWSGLYKAINAANILINKLPATPIAEGTKQQYIQAAKFVRALGYYHLVQLFGEVPLITDVVEDFSGVSTLTPAAIAEVYQLIVSDLTEAEALPASWDPVGRPTSGAAKALLAKVYISMAGFPLKETDKWALAAQKAQEVIRQYPYSLVPNYADLFLIAKKNSSEHIFSIQNNAGDASRSMLTVQARPREGLGNDSGWGTYYTTKRTMNLFDDADSRKAATFLTQFQFADGHTIKYTDAGWWKNTPHMKKYFDSGRANFLERNRRTDMNFNVIRLAEMYLIVAEALNEVSGPGTEAYAAINKLRERAYGNQTHNYAGLNKEQFREAVKKEWTYELTNEGKRRYNLLRWEDFESAMKANPFTAGTFNYSQHLYYPKPAREVAINPNL